MTFVRCLNFILILSSSITLNYAATIFIIESRSYMEAHNMDKIWEQAAIKSGHTAVICEQKMLDKASNLNDADLIIVSSAVIAVNECRLATLEQFLKTGRPVYIQSEYMVSFCGNQVFEKLTRAAGISFQWTASFSGDLKPMKIQLPFEGSALNYFWYGATGDGDSSVTPFLTYKNQPFAFLCNSPNCAYGKLMTVSDQDWIRKGENQSLLISIVDQLLIPCDSRACARAQHSSENGSIAERK